MKPLDLTVRIKQFQQNTHSSSSNCDSTEEDNPTDVRFILDFHIIEWWCNLEIIMKKPLQEKLISSEPDKKYRCDCGVSFSSEITLNGHKKYYCHNNANQAAPFREPQRKVLYISFFLILPYFIFFTSHLSFQVAYHCQQCDFLPVSASQLAQHIRVNHAAIQAYVCQICGYKGYSQRGIRSHLR